MSRSGPAGQFPICLRSRSVRAAAAYSTRGVTSKAHVKERAVQFALGLFISPPTLQALSKRRFETRRSILVGFALLTFAAIVIRLELIALIAPFALEHLLQSSVGLVELAVTGIVAALLSLGAFPFLRGESCART